MIKKETDGHDQQFTSKIDFFYIDLVGASANPGENVVSGPTSVTIAQEIPYSNFNLGYMGSRKGQRLEVQDPRLADHFLSIFDHRRLTRVWQNSRMVSVSLPLCKIRDVLSHPIRFITSAPAKFCVQQIFLGWSDNSIALKSQTFVSDVAEVPLFVVVGDGQRKCPAIFQLSSANGSASLITVLDPAEEDWESDESVIYFQGKDLARVISVALL